MEEKSLISRFRNRVFKLIEKHDKKETLTGYENPTLVNEIVKKTLVRSQQIKKGEPLENSELRIILGMLKSNLKSAVVVDFGGGAGTHFDIFSHLFPEVEFKYFVIETQEMARIASANRSNDTNLHFVTLGEINHLPKSIDLLVANSSLQYSEDPINTLAVLSKLAPKTLWITRFPLSETQDEYKIKQISRLEDNGPGSHQSETNQLVEYEANIVSIFNFEEELEKHFIVTTKVKEERNPFGRMYQSINSYGYLASLRR